MHIRLSKRWEALRSSFWFVPGLLALAAVGLASLMLWLDGQLPNTMLAEIDWVFSGGSEGARAVLSAIASSSITVAGTTFSITIAALSLASSQFGPHLLRNFVRDTGNQLVLGTFTATFLYCLLVLRTVRGLEDSFLVPHLSVTVAVGLALANLVVLIYFIHHVATSIQADQVITQSADELRATVDWYVQASSSLGAEPANGSGNEPERELPPDFVTDAELLHAQTNGYIQVMDTDRLLALSTRHELLVRLLVQPGDFVVQGEPLAQVWPPTHMHQQLRGHLTDVIGIGNQRTQQQDVAFGVIQLVEVALRALSPSTNDPFTAITCIDRLGAAFCHMAQNLPQATYRRDEQGKLRLLVKGYTFAELTAIAFVPLRQAACSHVIIVVHLLETLARMAAHTTTPAQRAVVRHYSEQLMADCRTALSNPSDRQRAEGAYQSVLHALAAVAHPPTYKEL